MAVGVVIGSEFVFLLGLALVPLIRWVSGVREPPVLVLVAAGEIGRYARRRLAWGRPILRLGRPPSNLAQLRQVRTQDHRSFGKDANGPTIRSSPSTVVVKLNPTAA